MELNGKVLATSIEKELQARVLTVGKETGKTPVLATILVGNDPASKTYVEMKAKACERIGIHSQKIHLKNVNTLKTSDLINTIQQLNGNSDVDGILLQHPVPGNIDERACFDAIDVEKDVDGVTTQSFGKLAMGLPAYACATPAGIIALLEHYEIPLQGQHAVVVGRSPILGKPMAAMLTNKNATVTLCHSKTLALPDVVKQADVVVGAVGKANFIKDSWLKDGAVIVDAGYHPQLKTGDIELASIKDRAFAYTPVPGGVGPMTIVMLMKQTVMAAEKKALSIKKF